MTVDASAQVMVTLRKWVGRCVCLLACLLVFSSATESRVRLLSMWTIQEMWYDLYNFSPDFADNSNGSELAMQAAANANMWHR